MGIYGAKRYQKENILPFDIFKQNALKKVEEITNFLSFMEEIEKDNGNIFLELNDFIINTRSVIYNAIEDKGSENKVTVHDFQKFIAYSADRQFQAYLTEKHIFHTNLYLSVASQSFPSKFVVMNDDSDVCYVDIFQQFYGRRSAPSSYHEGNIQSLKESISIWEEELNRFIDMKKNPYKYRVGLKDLHLILFKRKDLNTGIEKKIKNLENLIKDNNQKIQEAIYYLPIAKKKREKKEADFLLVQQFFSELKYTQLPDKDHRLY